MILMICHILFIAGEKRFADEGYLLPFPRKGKKTEKNFITILQTRARLVCV
jgi:hypothetical protein